MIQEAVKVELVQKRESIDVTGPEPEDKALAIHLEFQILNILEIIPVAEDWIGILYKEILWRILCIGEFRNYIPTRFYFPEIYLSSNICRSDYPILLSQGIEKLGNALPVCNFHQY